MPPYRGRGAFASASGQDFSSAPGKPVPSVKGLALHPARQPGDPGGADDMWLQMGQGTDSGGGEGKGDPVRTSVEAEYARFIPSAKDLCLHDDICYPDSGGRGSLLSTTRTGQLIDRTETRRDGLFANGGGCSWISSWLPAA
jgi:hypothetical protein